ncbi:MAG: hypothetical protein K0S82_617 [Gaiellaceae bacterium]|jgi:hypothetical protein|nr:hypothetical protein [Gaiellaceae bacterium]
MIGAALTRGALVVALAAGISSQTAGAAETKRGGAGGGQPRVIQLSYSEVNDGSRPRLNLMAFARRTDSVRLSTRYQGKQATGDTRYDKSITDTDINGNNAKHPFVLRRKQGGKRVVKLIRNSLDERGQARVRIRAARGGRVDAIKLRIVRAKCSLDPPLFPVDCEVERSGKHV